MKPFAIIVAFDAQYGMGQGGFLPWRLSLDLKHFKDITIKVTDPAKKNAVVMGHRTWNSLPNSARPLPQRVNMVLSRNSALPLPPEVLSAQDFEEALIDLSAMPAVENIFIIGGAQIYPWALAHPLCQKLYVTHVQGHFPCDVFFPPISRQFLLVSASEYFQEQGITFQFSEYLRQ